MPTRIFGMEPWIRCPLGLLLIALNVTQLRGACPNVTHGVSFDGGDIAAVAGASAGDCCEACRGNPACQAWTLYNGGCYLKDATSGAPTSCDSCVSGLAEASAEQPTCKVLDGRDARPDGNNFTSVPVSTSGQCCGVCGFTPGCVAWTYYRGVCYMKATFQGTVPCVDCTAGTLERGDTRALPAKFDMAGITFTGGRYCPNVTMGSEDSRHSLQHLASTGANWVSIVVTQYQWNISSTSIFPLYNGSKVRDVTSGYYEFITLTDAEVTAAIRHAHELGLKVMLKPHVDLLRNNKPSGQFWRGDIGGCPAEWNPPPSPPVTPFSDAQWDAWFASYSDMISHYAGIAEAEGVEMLSLNCELYCPNRQAERWRRVANATRVIYPSGLLTVSQIKGHEDEMKWWDAVDVIGIDAYYGTSGNTTLELAYSWAAHKRLARDLSRRYGKRVAFTEVGYCSGQCNRDHDADSADYERHAVHYAALFEAMRGEQDWFLGAFWWNWNTDDALSRGGLDDCLTPQWKPAEDVLRRYYRATAPKPQPPDRPPLCVGPGLCTC